MKKLTALLLLLPVIASAESSSWLKKDNPESLSIDVNSEMDCPVTKKEIGDIASKVLIRSRIKPLSGGLYDFQAPPYLSIEVHCMKPSDTGSMFIISLVLDFVGLIDLNDPHNKKEVEWPNANPDPVIFRHGIEPYAGFLMTADRALLKSKLKDAVEDFTADYINANFDLGDDK